MKTSSSGPDPQDAAAALAVVEALYAFADEPVRWEDMIAAIGALPTPLDPSRDAVASRILGHASRAAAMMDHLNAGRRVEQADHAPWDAILLTSEGRVRAIAGDAAKRLKPFMERPLAIGEFPVFAGASRRAAAEALAGVAQDRDPALTPITLDSEDGAERCFGVVLPREIFPVALAAEFGLGPTWAEPLVAMVLLLDRTSGVSGDTLARRLGFTAAEARLAAKLVQGLPIADAARELHITILTARSHLKNIFAKTGARRQSELIRLMTELSRFPDRGVSPPALANTPAATPRRFVALPDGRHLFYREYGLADGLPVLYFHVGLAASLVLPELVVAAETFGVRLIAFERPGFGQSTPHADYTFHSVARDVGDFLEKLGIDSVVLFGDGFGGAFAVAAAHLLKQRVMRLALRSPALGGFRGNEPRHVMSVLSRQPWIIPGIAEMMHRGMRIPFMRALMRHYADRSASDALREADPAYRGYFYTVVHDALERSSAGLSSELQLHASGERADPEGLSCPIGVWHGEDHPGLPASESVAIFSRHPNAQVHTLPETGAYFGQQEFDEMFRWLSGTSTR